jgi:DNA modification methylase
MTKNVLYCGDNLEILATMEKESVDLIYIDPPFFSNRHYEIIWGDEAEIRSFEDRWEGGINVYIEWMKGRVMELHRVLKTTGSMYLHCDWHAGHYLKMMCDEVFGPNNFRNEIIWHYKRWTAGMKDFQRMHDTIFRYCKTNNFTFNLQYEDYQETTMKYHKWEIDEHGNKFYVKHGKKIEPYRVYMNKKGVKLNDVWKLPQIGPIGTERLGYPTQKPEALLERIIKASSNEGDLVLDAFCGCGTALVVAQKLGRRWIGIDISPSAISLIKRRLNKIGVSESDIDITGMPQRVEDLKKFKPYEFQYWAINEMHGTPSPRKAADMGIDGFSFIEHHPIQVKQSESIGRNVVDNFETALRRYYKHKIKDMKGYIVAFSFGKGAREEVARVKKEGIDITLITVQDILDKKFSVLPSSESSGVVFLNTQ